MVRGARLPEKHRSTVDVPKIGRLQVTSPARTCLDVAREHGFEDGLVVADAALRLGIVTAKQLVDTVEPMVGWPGIVAAHAAVRFASGLRESPAESVSFVLFMNRGLEAPECNSWVVGEGVGGVRADFLWREHRVVGEVDGAIKYLDPYLDPRDALMAEKRRQERIEDDDYVVVRWNGREARREPDVVIDRILRASRRAHQMYGAPLLRCDPEAIFPHSGGTSQGLWSR